MGRKRTQLQRLIEHASTADETEVNTLIEALQAVKSARFAAVKRAARKPRSDAGKPRPARTPAPAPDPPATSE